MYKVDRYHSPEPNEMGDGTAWSGHLPCKQRKQKGSNPLSSTNDSLMKWNHTSLSKRNQRIDTAMSRHNTKTTISRESGTHGSLCGLSASAKVEKNCGKARIMWVAVILENTLNVLSRFWIVLLAVGYRTCGMVAGVRIFHNSIFRGCDFDHRYPHQRLVFFAPP